MHQSPLQFVDRVFTMYRLRQAQHAFAPLATRLTATAPSSSSTVHPSFASFSFAARGVRPGREREREREREKLILRATHTAVLSVGWRPGLGFRLR
jgi:hypothetical protein